MRTRGGGNDLTHFIGPILVLSEGPGDQGVMRAIKHKYALNFLECEYYGGRDNLSTFLRTMPTVPGFQSLRGLGVTRDADDDPTAAGQSMEDAIKAARLRTPPGMQFPRHKTLVLPGQGRPGALEALCIESTTGHVATPSTIAFRASLEAAGVTQAKPRNRDKAWVAAFLSGQGDRPPMRLPDFALNGLLDIGHACFAELRQFLVDLNTLGAHSAAPAGAQP